MTSGKRKSEEERGSSGKCEREIRKERKKEEERGNSV